MIRKLIALLLPLSVAASASSQSLPSAPYLTLSQRSSFLLMDQGTRERLKLTPDQSTTIMKAIRTLNTTQAGLMGKAEPDEQRLIVAYKTYAKGAWGAITAAQQQSLLKAALAKVGVHALVDEELVARLKLTPDQVGTIRPMLLEMKLRDEEFAAMVASGFEHLLPPATEEERAAQAKEKAAIVKSYDAERSVRAQEQQKTIDKILAALTTAQRAQWNELTAEAPSDK